MRAYARVKGLLKKMRRLRNISPLVQGAILAFKDSRDFDIISLLLAEGSMAFSELRERLHINQTDLDRRLNRLMNGAMVNNFYAKKEGSRKYSFYESTELATDLFSKLNAIQQPRSVIPVDKNPFYDPGPGIETSYRSHSGIWRLPVEPF